MGCFEEVWHLHTTPFTQGEDISRPTTKKAQTLSRTALIYTGIKFL